jgi:siderophore synthetase component
LVEQLIAVSGLKPEEFFEKKIVQPMLWNFFYMAFKFGLLFEAHPQNTLLELDQNFNPKRIIYRDLQAVLIDKETRTKYGLNNDGFQGNKIVGHREPQTNKRIEYSTLYDHRVAYQTLEEFIIALANKYIVSIEELRRIVQKNARRVFNKLGINPDDYFPKNSYYLFRDGMNKDSKLIATRHFCPPYR